MLRRPIRCSFFLLSCALLLPAWLHAQGTTLRVMGAWGTNILTSPGTDMSSSPARSGHLALGFLRSHKQGGPDLEAAIRLSGNAYHTRMAYRVFFVSQRTTLGLDLLFSFPQGGGSSLKAGVFGDLVMAASSTVYQQGQGNSIPVFNDPRIRNEHMPTDVQAGIVLGIHVPLGSGKVGMDLQLRQHLVPLVQEDQSFNIPFQAEQQVLATNTRATVLTAGLSYRFLRSTEDAPASR